MRLKKLLFVTVLMMSSYCFAGSDDNCCCFKECFNISAEWLYVHPGIENPYFVNRSNSSVVNTGENIKNDFKWHSAYRVEALYHANLCCCPLDLRVRWTHLPTFSESRSVEAPVLLGLIFESVGVLNFTDNAFARVNDQIEFYYLDVLFGTSFIDCPCFKLNLQGGIQYAKLCFEENLFLDSRNITSFDITEKSDYWGIGPELAMDLQYICFKCFQIVGRGQFALLANERKGDVLQITDTGAIGIESISLERAWYLSPTATLRFGLVYNGLLNLLCCCTHFDIEVGYEATWVNNGLFRVNAINASSGGVTTNDLMNFTMHGPYIHAGLSF